jgi:hypothetical protein
LTLRARQDGSGTFSPAAPVTKTVNIVARGESFEAWMKRHFGSSASVEALRSVDTDKDGVSNLQEYQAATDPRDGNSRFQVTAPVRNGAAFEVRWEGKRGIKYRVMSSSDLQTWSELPDSRRQSTGQTESASDAQTPAPARRFYRVEVLDSP